MIVILHHLRILTKTAQYTQSVRKRVMRYIKGHKRVKVDIMVILHYLRNLPHMKFAQLTDICHGDIFAPVPP